MITQWTLGRCLGIYSKQLTYHILIYSKQDELNQADSEVENSKRRLQHYEDKQKEHLACIKRHKELLATKEKELEVGVGLFFFIEVSWSWSF